VVLLAAVAQVARLERFAHQAVRVHVLETHIPTPPVSIFNEYQEKQGDARFGVGVCTVARNGQWVPLGGLQRPKHAHHESFVLNLVGSTAPPLRWR